MKEINIIELINDYTINGHGLTFICEKYKIGKIKAKSILKSNGVEIKKKGKQALNEDFVVKDFKIKKYVEEEGFHYIAVDKQTGITFNDYMNLGGFLTSYIKKQYNVEIPTLYDRRLYYMRTGNYWWEQWFDIVKEKNNDNVKKCPYCDWSTIDLDNRSGAYTTHILSHGITMQKHLEKCPEDKDILKKQSKIIEKNQKFDYEKNFVICPLCNKKMSKITYSHLKNQHNIGLKEFKTMYPDYQIMSDEMIEQIKYEQQFSNLYVSKKRFVSKYEKELQTFLNDNNISFNSNRQILIGKEIDILIEDKKIGIEFNGLKWHSEWFGKKDKYYHLNKTLKCNEKGYGLIHIFEDEYVYKKDIVLNKLKHLLKLNSHLPKIGGRKIKVKEIYKSDAELFLNENHIQGFVSSSSYMGGFYNGELVAVMAFKNTNIKYSEWELTRFATKPTYIYQGVGGKIFKYFTKTYNPNKIVSFADRRWTPWENDNLYIKLGFTLDSINKPDYKYYNELVDRHQRFHKFGFRKQHLHKKYDLPLTMTETEMVKALGYDRIWDCGLFKFVWKNNE